MQRLIEFRCPACHVLLRVPIMAAGQNGPCPACGVEISAPYSEPERANEGWFEPTQPMLRPIVPFDERAFRSEQMREHAAHELVPAHEAHVAATLPAPTAPHRGISRSVLVLSCLLSGLSMLAAGYLLGAFTYQLVIERFQKKAEAVLPELVPSETSSHPPVREKTKVVIAKNPDSISEQVVVKQATEKEPQVMVARDGTQAAAALRAFLEAPDWASQSAYVYQPSEQKPRMQAYAEKHGDGPTSYSALRWIDCIESSNKSEAWHVFEVARPDGSPAILTLVVGNASGHWVDWESFVEFRDDHFQKFVSAGKEARGVFRLSVAAAGDHSAANPHFSAYQLNPPRPGSEQIAFAKRGSMVDAQLKVKVEQGQPFAPMLEIAQHRAADGRMFLEIVNVVSPTWHEQDP